MAIKLRHISKIFQPCSFGYCFVHDGQLEAVHAHFLSIQMQIKNKGKCQEK
jgi:hypothetical protein